LDKKAQRHLRERISSNIECLVVRTNTFTINRAYYVFLRRRRRRSVITSADASMPASINNVNITLIL